MGITTMQKELKDGRNDYTQAMVLGGITNGVKNVELTAAYATIANGGVYEKPVFYTKITDHDGNVLIDNTEAYSRTVLKDSTAWLLTSAMQDVVTTGTGKAVNFGGMSVASASSVRGVGCRTSARASTSSMCFTGTISSPFRASSLISVRSFMFSCGIKTVFTPPR